MFFSRFTHLVKQSSLSWILRSFAHLGTFNFLPRTDRQTNRPTNLVIEAPCRSLKSPINSASCRKKSFSKYRLCITFAAIYLRLWAVHILRHQVPGRGGGSEKKWWFSTEMTAETSNDSQSIKNFSYQLKVFTHRNSIKWWRGYTVYGLDYLQPGDVTTKIP